ARESKSGAEPYINRQMTKPMREWLDSMLNEFYSRFLSEVADRRGQSESALRALFDKGGLTAREGLEAKLVDALGYPEDAEAQIRKAAGVVSDKRERIGARRY